MRIGDYIVKTESSEEKCKLEGVLKWHNFKYDEKFENKKEGFDVFVVNIIHKSYFEIAYYDVGINRISMDEFFKKIHYDDNYWITEIFDDDVLVYRGYVDGDNRPYGLGTSYYPDGKIFQEGLFDHKGLIEGKDYYPSGQLHFEGVWYIATGYGPNAPKCGNLYDESGNLIFTGKFEVRTGGVGFLRVRYPQRFSRIPENVQPKISYSRVYFVKKRENMNLKNKLDECENLYELEEYDELIKKCDEVLEEFPDNENAMGYKGFSYYALGDDDKALEILERGVELYPNNYYLKNNLAMVYYALGDYETSLKLCEEGLEIRDFEWLCENKFKNLIRLDRYDEAIEFEKSIDHDLSLHSIFMEEDMSEHELNYFYHLLKEKPDDKFLIGMIKMISEKLGKTPDI